MSPGGCSWFVEFGIHFWEGLAMIARMLGTLLEIVLQIFNILAIVAKPAQKWD